MTRHREDPPPRYGICDTCDHLQELYFTGQKTSVKCKNNPYGVTRCLGTIHLPANREVQAGAQAAYRLGGPDAARPVLEDYFFRFLSP